MIAQDKTVGESISDTTIWAKIKTGLANKGIDNILGTVSIEIQEGRVLLTGTVNTKDKIITILQVCWNVNGVKEVINELRIKDSNEQYGALDHMKDAWITTKIKSKLLASREVQSVNYSVESMNGIVYLFGTAQSQQELDTAIDLTSSTTHVKKVVSYVKVKKDLSSRLAETKGIKHADDQLAPYDSDNATDFNSSPEHQGLNTGAPPHGPSNPVVQDDTLPTSTKPETKSTKTAIESDTVFEKDDF